MSTKEERKQNLLLKKKKIEEEIKKHENPTDFGSDVDGFDEETDEAEETANNLGLLKLLKDQLREINKALEEIEK